MNAATTKYGQKKHVKISKSLLIFVFIFFIGCLVATGLVVYNFFSCSVISQDEQSSVTTDSLDLEIESTLLPTTTQVTEIDLDELDVRLPRSILPDSYKLKLIPFLQEGNFTFHGEVDILINVTETTKNITLHASELDIDNVRVSDANWNTVSIRNTTNIKKKQFFVIDLDEEILAQNQYYVYIKFRGVLNDILEGFYRSSYQENNETRWIATTQFQPTDARKCFPCFDEPGLKARFRISIARLKNMTSISNMRKTYSSSPPPNLPNYVWDNYEESVPMSTYLIAFVVSDFDKITNGKISIWTRKNALYQAQYALKITPLILKYYEKFFGIKYPLPKLDMVAIPDFLMGGMENWGLITYSESDLLYEKGVSSRSTSQGIAHMIAHELAHQWFGNLVTPTWWTDLWLNEGFATYVQYLGAYAVQPKWKDPDLFVIYELQEAFSLDALSSSHPISIKVNNPDEINDIFDTISYCKGASIIRMMQHFLTAKVFHNGLKQYLEQKKYSNAEQDDLWKVLTIVSHKNHILNPNVTVKEIMDTWTLQTGYPLVTASVNPEDNSIILTQQRFFLDKENKSDDSVWWIPITYIDRKRRFQNAWMRKERNIILSNVSLGKDDWFLLNVNQTGYYRVNYDIGNWYKIINQLQKPNGFKIFDPKNRAQILDDVLNLAFSGYVSYDIALNITLYLINEREYIPWYAGLENLSFFYDRFVRTAHFDKYKTYILYLIRDFYYELGFKESADDELLTVLSRVSMVRNACLFGFRDCRIKAVQKFQKWMNTTNPDVNNDISPDLRRTIYCTAISNGGQEEWDFVWQRYLNANVANDKVILLFALGCTKEIWILNRYLEWAVTDGSGIRKQDSAEIFASISENPVGQNLAYGFFKANWGKIRSYLGPSSASIVSIVSTLTAHFNTQEEVDDFKSFFTKKYDEFGSAIRTAQQSIEQAEANVKWMKTYFAGIVQWLSRVKYEIE